MIIHNKNEYISYLKTLRFLEQSISALGLGSHRRNINNIREIIITKYEDDLKAKKDVCYIANGTQKCMMKKPQKSCKEALHERSQKIQ